MSLTPEQLFKEIERKQAERAASMPKEIDALSVILSGVERLRELGWNDIVYCPKDGSMFLAVEAGSCGIFDCHYEGEWPNGHWWIFDAGDSWPSRPLMWKKKPETNESVDA